MNPPEYVSIKTGEIDLVLTRVLAGKENFIGFVDSEDVTIQVFVDEIDRAWIEVPIPAKKGSYGKSLTNKEVAKVIGDLKEPYSDYIQSLNLKFEAW